jgi:integrase
VAVFQTAALMSTFGWLSARRARIPRFPVEDLPLGREPNATSRIQILKLSQLSSLLSRGVFKCYQLKGLAPTKMSEAGLSAKTIVNYVQAAKLVVASAVNDEGEQVYPRSWNHDFIQLPVVRKDKQHRPTVTDADLKEILSNTKKQKHVMLFSLLAATGLRIGEALALRSTDFGPDCRVLHVRRSVWRGQEQEPKTSNAVRVVDIPEVLAVKLREFVASTNGYLFATAKGHLLQQRNVLRILHRVKPLGFHAFRRFRLTWLRKNSVPKDLERYWMGHEPEEVGDLYSKLKDDVSFHQEWAERAGLRFELVHVGLQNAGAVRTKRVA